MEESGKFLKASADLENRPLLDAQRIFFVDGLCFRADVGNKAVAEDKYDLISFNIVIEVSLPQPCLAQLAEIRALTAACKLGNGKNCTIYSDSAYAYRVCHMFGPIWAQRGFQRADGSTITHGAAISDLLHAMTLPAKQATVKYQAHKSDGSFVTRGNTAADEGTMKAALGSTRMMALLNSGEESPQEENLDYVVSLQVCCTEAEIANWIARGAKKELGTGLWRSIDGVCVAPLSLLPLLIKDAHGLYHTARVEILKKIRQDWWSPYLASSVEHELKQCNVCT